MFKKNNLDLKITCVVILILLLLNKLKKSLTFIVTQIYDLVANNLDTNMSKTSLIDNNNKLVLFNTTSIDIYNLDTKSKNLVT